MAGLTRVPVSVPVLSRWAWVDQPVGMRIVPVVPVESEWDPPRVGKNNEGCDKNASRGRIGGSTGTEVRESHLSDQTPLRFFSVDTRLLFSFYRDNRDGVPISGVLTGTPTGTDRDGHRDGPNTASAFACYSPAMSPAPVRIVGVSVPLQDLLVLAFTAAVAATVACAVCGAVAVAVVVAVSVI